MHVALTGQYCIGICCGAVCACGVCCSHKLAVHTVVTSLLWRVLMFSCLVVLQEKQLEQLAGKARKKLPADLDYASISTLSMEAREKLAKFRPADIGQASRLGGVNPADISALLMHLEIQKRRAAAAERTAGASSGVSSDEEVTAAAAAVAVGR